MRMRTQSLTPGKGIFTLATALLVIGAPMDRSTNMSQEKTVEELIYELGNYAMLLSISISAGKNEREIIQVNYDPFRTRALKLGVQLPDLPENDLTDQGFLSDQITEVRKYIELHKTESMSQMFELGNAAEVFLKSLLIAKTIIEDKTPEERHSESLETLVPAVNKCLQNLIENAKKLDEDSANQLKEELKKDCDNLKQNFDQDLDSIRVRLKKKLCGSRSKISSPPLQLESSSAVYKRSEVDPTREITDQRWTVSLVRLPDRSNPQHAFIVLEGKTGRKSKIWFTDFVAAGWFASVDPGTEEGKVRIEYYDLEGEADPTGRLLFKCQKRMMDVRAEDHLLFSTWPIAKTTAEYLIQMIEAQQKTPPKYHILGNNSVLAGSSATSSSNPTGHNCFTFAKKMLRDLNDQYIELPEDGLDTWICSATSRYLIDKRFRNRKWYEKSSFHLMFGFLFGAVVAFFFLKAF